MDKIMYIQWKDIVYPLWNILQMKDNKPHYHNWNSALYSYILFGAGYQTQGHEHAKQGL